MITALALAAALSTSACDALKATARPALEHANGDWVRAMQARDADAIAAAYAEDGLFVRSDGAVVSGRAAVAAMYAEALKSARPILGGGIRSDGLACGGPDLLFEWGQGWLTQKGADGEVTRGGPYLTVWKRIGGQWKIARNLSF